MRWGIGIVALALAGAVAVGQSARDTQGSSVDRVLASAPADPKLPHELTVDRYAPADRQIVQGALDEALRNLRDRNSELEVAAAINAYLHQYFVNENATGTGAHVIAGGQAACGGASTSMQEMLYLAGIRSRPAVLLGIPYQGNHSLVEVQFSDGTRGLFDPTFGVFFYDRRAREPVPLRSLLRDPDLAAQTLMKTRFEKRRSKQALVTSIESIATAYDLRRDYWERARQPGDSQMDWQLAFRVRRAGGVGGSGEQMRVPVRLAAGKLYGTLQPPTDGQPPWNPLALEKDPDGVSLPWAYMIGSHGGFNVAHRYRIRDLRPGRRYRITFTYANAREVRLRLQLANRAEPLSPVTLSDLIYQPGVAAQASASVAFTARRRRETISARTRQGSALYQAIRVTRLPVDSGDASRSAQ